jgi:hypothetical protein
MPRKRWRSRLSSYDVPDNDIDPNAPVPVEDHVLVRHALVDFDELSVLSPEKKEQLVADLVHALRYTRCGINAGKRGVSNKALAQQVFLSDVGRALERAGLPAKRWRKRYDDGDGPSADAPESFFFRLAREVADVSGMAFPQDLKLAGKRAMQHQYGTMSPAMKTAQEVALAERQQCLTPPRDLIQVGVECIRQQSAAAKELKPEHVPQPNPKAIEERTRREMEMGKKMNAYHASCKPVPRKPTSSKLRLPLK